MKIHSLKTIIVNGMVINYFLFKKWRGCISPPKFSQS